MFRPRNGRIPVTAGPRLVELAGPERLQKLMQAANVKIIRKRKTGTIVEIQLLEFGNDTRIRSRVGNPQALSHRAETDENPRGCWELKRVVDVSAPAAK